MYAQIGGIRFEELKGFGTLERARATNFAEVARVNRKPSLQRVGESLQTISLSILLHRDFTDPESDMEAFDQIRKQADSVPFLLGNGSVLGNFLILSVNESIKKTADDGTVIYLTADLELKEYSEGNLLEAVAITARQNGYATSIDKVVPSKELQIAPSEGAQAGTLSTSANVEAVNIDAEVERAVNNAGARPSLFQSIGSRADLASLAALELANKVRALQDKISTAEQIAQDAEALSTLAANVKAATVNADIDEVASSNATFQAAADALRASSSIIVQLIASRKI